MPKAIISDTSCFIALVNIGELEILRKVYGEIITTIEVINEFGEQLPDWVIVQSPSNNFRQNILELQIDKGEASAIALALEIPESIVILDDNKARKIAEQLGLEITGTIGVIIKAKLSGIIPTIKPYLDKLKKSNFRLTEELEKLACKEAKE